MKQRIRRCLVASCFMLGAGLATLVLAQDTKEHRRLHVAATFVDINPDESGPIAEQLQVGIRGCPDPCPSGGSGGRVNGLTAVPGEPSTYFAASELGGLFKTTNGGDS